MRQNQKRRLRNKTRRTRIKNLSKAVETAIAEKAPEKAQSCLKEAQKYIEKIGHRKGTLHRRTASRKISRLTRKVNTLLKKADSA